MKTCTSCKEDKPFSEFYKLKRSPDGFNWLCKVCANDANTVSMKLKPNKYSDIRRKTSELARERYHQYKRDKGCACCPENEPVCLELHHLNGDEKEGSPSRYSRGSWERFIAEAEKCIVVCSNCHKKIHAGLITKTKDGEPVIV